MPKAATKSLVYFHFLHKRFSLKNRTALKLFIEDVFKKEKKPLRELQYIFCSDAYLLEINRQYLKHDFYTDIISFNLANPKTAVQGEIYISIDRVKENARKYNTPFRRELHRVIFHGALHLCGYKDKSASESKRMRTLEEKSLSLYFKD